MVKAGDSSHRRTPSKITLTLLDFHGTFLVVIDDPVFAFRAAEGKSVFDDLGLGVSASERIAPVHGLQPSERMRHLIICGFSPGTMGMKGCSSGISTSPRATIGPFLGEI